MCTLAPVQERLLQRVESLTRGWLSVLFWETFIQQDNYLLLSFVSHPCLRKWTHTYEKISASDWWWLLIVAGVVKVCFIAQLCPGLCNPMGCSLHLPMEFSRQDYRSEYPFSSPKALLDPGIKPRSPALQADSLPSEPPGEPPSSN